ncbi:hypothetical protein ACN38_g9728 [Penicillium nordicum]|uniref:Uncharacterized protein n=1 Tax=Penicillium nordicum TaxID=229535 RepID=A0A0M8P2Q4_9EURO|nr:hypothetical protein ACN38_g9728 [Penicillium nordicum]
MLYSPEYGCNTLIANVGNSCMELRDRVSRLHVYFEIPHISPGHSMVYPSRQVATSNLGTFNGQALEFPTN